MNLVDEQIAIENNAHNEAKARYDKGRMKADSSFVRNPISQNLLSHLVPVFADQLEKWWVPKRGANWQKFYRELSLDSIGISIAALRTMFTELFQKDASGLVDVASKVYKAVHLENAYSEFKDYGKRDGLTKDQKYQWAELSKKVLRETRQKTTERKRDVIRYARKCLTDLETTEANDRVKAGLALITVALTLRVKLQGCSGVSKVFQLKTERKGTKLKKIIVFSHEVHQFLREREVSLGSVLFSYYPMVVKPTPWEGLFGGGYLTARGKGNLPLIKSHNIKLYKDEDIGPEIYKAVNTIQETPWRINKKVYAVMDYCAMNGIEIKDLPVRAKEFIVPPKLDDDIWEAMSREERGVVIEERKRAYKEVEASSSKILSLRLKLSMARRFLKYEEIYYPHTLDFRGRIYPIAAAVNPQSDKFGQSLLEFAQGQPLGPTGKRWLAIHGANSWGLDSESFDVRLSWVETQAEAISATAQNPLGEREYWSQADDPFGFLAFCFEWAEMLKHADHEQFVSHLPVKLDATSSGLQHYSAIFRDDVGAVATNLVDGERSDIYKLVAQESEKLVDHDVDTETDQEVKAWKRSFKRTLNRNICKPATMCLPYGVTLFGSTDDLFDLHADGKMEGLYLTKNHTENMARFRYMAKTIMSGVGKVVHSAIEGMAWLKLVDKLASAAKTNKELRYRTKLGFPFIQQYYKSRVKRVNMFLSETVIKLNTRIKTRQIDARKSNTAIAPNFIHSQDATHLMKCALMSHQEGITSFSFIHDSFGTHAGSTERFRDLIRESFVWLYSDDTLGDLKKQLVGIYPEVDFPEPPYDQYGTLDVNDCLKSSYMFN